MIRPFRAKNTSDQTVPHQMLELLSDHFVNYLSISLLFKLLWALLLIKLLSCHYIQKLWSCQKVVNLEKVKLSIYWQEQLGTARNKPTSDGIGGRVIYAKFRIKYSSRRNFLNVRLKALRASKKMSWPGFSKKFSRKTHEWKFMRTKSKNLSYINKIFSKFIE